MSAIGDAIADLFEDDSIAFDATYTAAAGGPGVRIRVIYADADKNTAFGVTGAVAREIKADIRLAAVPAPAKGDELEIAFPYGAQRFRIKARPLLDRVAGMANLELEPL